MCVCETEAMQAASSSASGGCGGGDPPEWDSWVDCLVEEDEQEQEQEQEEEEDGQQQQENEFAEGLRLASKFIYMSKQVLLCSMQAFHSGNIIE